MLFLLVFEKIDCDPIQDCTIPSVDELDGQVTEFYECIETILKCGDDGYLLSYGVKYAERFNNEARQQMDDNGKEWVDGTTVCLQTRLRDAITAESDCEEVSDIGFGTHNDCYIENGFCNLGFQNWLAVVGVLAVKDILTSLPEGIVLFFRCLIGWL